MPHDGRVGVGLESRFLPVEDFFSSRALASSLGFFGGARIGGFPRAQVYRRPSVCKDAQKDLKFRRV